MWVLINPSNKRIVKQANTKKQLLGMGSGTGLTPHEIKQIKEGDFVTITYTKHFERWESNNRPYPYERKFKVPVTEVTKKKYQVRRIELVQIPL